MTNKDYSYEVIFNLEQNRWTAKFTANRFPISYSFPLIDPPAGQQKPRALSVDEEAILGLVFTQMVGLILHASAQRELRGPVQAPPSATETALS